MNRRLQIIRTLHYYRAPQASRKHTPSRPALISLHSLHTSEALACSSVRRFPLHQLVNLRQSAGTVLQRHLCDDANTPTTTVSYSELLQMLSSGNIQLIDVREPEELAEVGAIPGSVNVPLGELQAALESSADKFEEVYKAKKPGTNDGTLVFLCLAGIRSQTAMDLARELGYLRVRHFAGGYEEWLDRQS